MNRSEAQQYLKSYTARVLAIIERRRSKAVKPIWLDCFDAAAACNQSKLDMDAQLDRIVELFGDLTEMLLKVIKTLIRRFNLKS